MARLYPKKGFTRRVERVLLPYIARAREKFLAHSDLPDLAYFEEAPKEALLEAARYLPEEQMGDQQNLSPTLEEMLVDPLAVAYSGYIVRAVREDERLTVDTVYYPFTVEGLARALEVAREFPPDEQGEVVLVDGTRALVLWWD